MDTEIIITNWGGLSGRFLNLLNSGDMFDVQLKVGKQLFDAHKLILCASSDVFKIMLTSRKWSESNKKTIELSEEPLCETVFGRFIHYIYTGQLYLSHKTVCPMLTLADKYNVKELIPLCQKYMVENLDAPLHISCVLQWWTVSSLRNDKYIEKKVLSYIDLNFNKLIQSPDFLCSGIDTVEKLLSRSNLVVNNELMIYCGVKNWIQTYVDYTNPPCKEILTLLSRLMRHIRLPMMTADEIEWLKIDLPGQRFMLDNMSAFSPNLPSSLLEGGNCPDFQREIMAVTEYYNDLCLSSQDMQAEIHQWSKSSSHNLLSSQHQSEDKANLEHKNLFLSRVYTCDYWGTELKVADFSAFPNYGVQTFFFSTPHTGFCQDDGNNLDWEVELHPKGVHFPPAIMIGLEGDGSKLIDEVFVDTVRLSVISRSPQEKPLKVEVNILVQASSLAEPGTTYFERNHCHTCFFEREGQRQNFDDIVPVDKLEMYLQTISPIPELHLTPTVAFSLCIVIRPLLDSSSR